MKQHFFCQYYNKQKELLDTLSKVVLEIQFCGKMFLLNCRFTAMF